PPVRGTAPPPTAARRTGKRVTATRPAVTTPTTEFQAGRRRTPSPHRPGRSLPRTATPARRSRRNPTSTATTRTRRHRPRTNPRPATQPAAPTLRQPARQATPHQTTPQQTPTAPTPTSHRHPGSPSSDPPRGQPPQAAGRVQGRPRRPDTADSHTGNG